MYPMEYIDKLNCRAVQLINLGAIINIIFGKGNFILTGIDEIAGTFVVTTALSIGTVMLSFCTFILGPWEFMVGSPLLAIGLLLRACATYLPLVQRNVVNSDVGIDLNIAACPFVFIALDFFMKKAYQLMRLPVLASDNFRFFGVILYGGSIMANAIVSIVQGIGTNLPDANFGFILSIISSLAFFGTSIFLLDGSRVKHHCDAILEDRYPSTMYLVRHKEGFITASGTSCLALGSSFATSIVLLKEEVGGGLKSYSSFTSGAEFLSSILIALAIFALCFISLHPSLHIALELQENQTSKVLRGSIAGFIIFALGGLYSGLFALVSAYGLETENVAAARWTNALGLISGSILVVSNLPLETAPCKVVLFQPTSWENVYHPSNYLLLSSIWLVIGSAIKFAAFRCLGFLAHSWAFAVLLLHWHMAFYVWESMTLQACKEKTSNEVSIDESKEDNFYKR